MKYPFNQCKTYGFNVATTQMVLIPSMDKD